MYKDVWMSVRNPSMTISCSANIISFLVVNLILMIFMAFFFSNPAIVIIGMIGASIALFCSKGLPGNYYAYMIIVLFIMMLYLMVHYYGLIEEYGIPYYALDDEYFEAKAQNLYENNIFTFRELHNIEFLTQGNAKGYPLTLSWMYAISLGHYHTAMPRILNLYMWLSLAILSLKMLRIRISNRKIEKGMFFALALFPNGLYISCFVYRDVLTAFLLVVIVYNVTMLLNKNERGMWDIVLPHLLVILICTWYLSYIRMPSVYICVLLSVLIYINKLKDAKLQKKIWLLLSVPAILVIGIMLLFNLWDLVYKYTVGYTQYLLSQNYGLSSRIFSLPIFPIGWILRGTYGLVVPFPAALLSLPYFNKPLFALSNAVTYIGTLFQIFMLPYFFKAIIKRNVNALMWIVVYTSIVLTTFTFRHFIMPVPFFAVAVAEEYIGVNGVKRLKNIGVIMVGIIVLMIIYLLMKG